MPSLPPVHTWPAKARAKARRREGRDRSGDVRVTARWKRLRAWMLANHPLCSDPFGSHEREGRAVAAEQVHHIRPVATHPDEAMDVANLATICQSCHSRVSAMERRGEQAKAEALFKGEG